MSEELQLEEPLLKGDHDQRLVSLSKLIAGGYDPVEAAKIAFIGEELDDASALAICQMPVVEELVEAILNSGAPNFALSKEQTLAHLRSIVETPIQEITADSPLCQSVQYHWKTGAITKITAVDKLKALDMSNRIQGFYDDKLTIDADDKILDIMKEARADHEEKTANAIEV